MTHRAFAFDSREFGITGNVPIHFLYKSTSEYGSPKPRLLFLNFHLPSISLLAHLID